MKLLATTALVLSMTMIGTAFAQSSDPAAIYDAYLAAVEAGDYATASQQGEAAWRAAETEWGESGDTGLLAYTIGQLRVGTGDLAGAKGPAARALELAPLATGLYTEDEARLLVGASLATENPAQARQELEAALAGLDGAGVAPRDDIVSARLTLAQLQAADDPALAATTAAKAVEDSRAAGSANLRSHLATAGRVQYLAGQFGPAAFSLRESLGYWEEQEPGVLPQPLADTLAWHTLATAALRQTPVDGAPAAPPAGPGGVGGPGGFGGIGFTFVPRRNCDIEWEPIVTSLPEPEGTQANLGASVIMYDITEEGTVTNARIVSAVPSRQYEQEILAGMQNWKASNRVREACRTGQLQTVDYFY